MPHNAWLFSFVLVSLASAGAAYAATETVTLKNGKTYEVEVDRRGEPVGAENRQVEITLLGAFSDASSPTDLPEYGWMWNARLKRTGAFKVTVTTPIDEMVSASFEVVGRGEIGDRSFFNREEYPTLWTWLDEPETSWIPFVLTFEDTQSDNTFALMQWTRFDAPVKDAIIRNAHHHAFTTTEIVQPIFDGRVWKLGYTATQGDQTLWEYVLSGETVENWSELITVQSFTGSQGSTAPVELMRRVRDLTLRDCPDQMWNPIRESETEVLYESRQEGCQVPFDSDDQYEIRIIKKGLLGLHSIGYGNKRQPHLPEMERSEWIDRISRAEPIVRVGVADNTKRTYPRMPTRAFHVEGGFIAVQAGVRGDSERTQMAFGMKYPTVYFVNLINETDRPVWAEVRWYFPRKNKKKEVKPKIGPVPMLTPGQSHGIWWRKYGVIADTEIPITITVFSDEQYEDVLGEEKTFIHFREQEVSVFFQAFDESSGGSGRLRKYLPVINGWYEMPHPKGDIPGTATDADLQEDIQFSLWKEESKQYRDCNHETQRAESADDKVNTVAASSMSETGERNEPVSKSLNVLREFWWVRSCDVTSKYEVLLAESSDGAAEITATRIGEIN
jgi:hypothetical protein